ncbi:type II toxin-antitoxin system RelE/ParE family toxin [Sedimentitalea todarodis]|uniref:Type II toxin-antitoxin system RelE/ParE family toxin n=1 Tax=Sedimentitalea todarodis TaxID=1631240 RepID=A0ABU3VLY1_9RHOB|nr:type II toxin-antitoxin system RelE/ParE family toxin [Sedimentitalea todarodis]MDU9007204.1 type II toxin-antitoxin system RelE/ParE family toxin [Sedimentitalea todarodis]
MNRTFRLTRRAEDSLVEIARWTIQNFGSEQADFDEAEIIDRCEAIARGPTLSRSCSILVDEAQELQFARAGEHFLVFLDQADEAIVVEILHSRSDIPRHVGALTTLNGV